MHNRVAIFGGTFDPFTVAHREICKQIINSWLIDKLYVIPTVVDYHRQGKDKCLEDWDKILCMKHMLWSLGPEYIDKWVIDTHEIDLKRLCLDSDTTHLYKAFLKPRRFIHTLLDFKCRVGVRTEIILVLGTDEAINFHKWYQYQDILDNIDYLKILIGRDGAEASTTIRKIEKQGVPVETFFLFNVDLCKVSASNVRETFADGRYDHRLYCSQVDAYDRGEKSLEELKWI